MPERLKTKGKRAGLLLNAPVDVVGVKKMMGLQMGLGRLNGASLRFHLAMKGQGGLTAKNSPV
ncbi:hypothetical protein GCM10011339_00550 [Echinicola rosea]|uniref:Uncharacterized protein n=1 Tax=Echinicola rosea TaxID=1807691 RepID=A0ABQ1UDL5_9BACT|nr:hypothetical protein GCM10011339_00550 [Echinicola rosea]